MVITCNNCQRQYKIDPEKITEKGAKITCPACGHSFIVRRKTEAKPEAPKIKTPPCEICGNPSTRVLRGDPPMTLCEHCFEIENEKRRRFSVFEKQPEPSAPAEGPVEEPVKESAPQDDLTRVGDQYISPPAPEEVSPKEDEYVSFDDEMPDFTSIEPPPPPTPQEEPVPPDEPEFAPPPPAEDTKPLEQESEGSGEPETPPSPEMPPPRDEFSYQAQEDASPEALRPEPEPEQEETSPEPFRPEPEPEQEGTSPEPFRPEPEPEQEEASPEPFRPEIELEPAVEPPLKPAGVSLEDEVEQGLLHEDKRPSGVSELEFPSPPAYQPRSHVPAYLVSAGILLIAAFGLIYYLYSQDFFSYFKDIIPSSSTPTTELAQPAPGPDEESTEQVALRKQADAKRLADQINTSHRFFLLDTPEGYQKAIAEMESALKLKPHLAEAEAFIIEAYAFYASLKDNAFFNKRAERLLEKASPEVVLRPEYDRARAHVLINQGQGKAARDILERILEKDNEDALAYYLLGRTYLLDSPPSLSEAAESFEKAVALSPELTRAYWELAGVLRDQGQDEQARAMYKEVLKHSPNKSEAELAMLEMEESPEPEAAAPSAEAKTPPAPVPAEPELSKAPSTPEPAPLEPSDLTPIETIEKIGEEVPTPEEMPQAVGLEVSGDQISTNIKQILSIIEQPLSRVRQKTQPAPAPQPVSPRPSIPYPERPPEEAP
jgi:predicted Zn finger-like uncharacterized protein